MIPCTPYISEQDLTDCGLCEIGAVSADQATQILEIASQVLFLKTGQQFWGQCLDTVRPCNCGCGPVTGDWAGPWPSRSGAGWQNTCGCGSTYCGAGGAAIQLPNRPVIAVSSVLIDGDIFTDWRLDSPGWLIRTDGGVWPDCQNATLDTTQPGTWEVSYLWGKVAPEAVRFATTVLAAELVKACAGDEGCRIPAGAVSITRRNVTYNVDLTGGKTGLYEVDLIIDTFNPKGLKRKARIYAPDDFQFIRSVAGS